MTAKRLVMDKRNEESIFQVVEILKTRTELVEKAEELKEIASNKKIITLWKEVYEFIFRSIYKTKLTNIEPKEDKHYNSGHLALMKRGLGWRRNSSYSTYTYRITNIEEQVETIFKYGTKLIPYFKEKDRTSIGKLVKWAVKNYKIIKETFGNKNPMPKTVLEIDREIMSMFGKKVRINKIKYGDGGYRGCNYKEIRVHGTGKIVENPSWRTKTNSPTISVHNEDLQNSYLYFVLRKEINEFYDKCKEELIALNKEINMAVDEFKETFNALLVLNSL